MKKIIPEEIKNKERFLADCGYTEKTLDKAIAEFHRRDRRYGGVKA